MAKSPEVAIILLNYNGRDLLEKYLSSIENLNYNRCEVILVDNNSNDTSIDYVKENHPNVTIVESDENIGFSRGNNLGAAKTNAPDYYWFLNTDVRVTPQALDKLVSRIENDDDVGIVVPRINNMDDGSIQSLGYKYGISGVPRAISDVPEEGLDRPQQITYGSGAALLIDVDVWNEIGGFDDENFMYGDDTYLCLNAWLRGYCVEVVPRSVVYHEEGASQTEEQGPLIAYHNAKGRTRCYLLTLELKSIFVGFSGYLLHSLFRIGKDVRKGEFRTASWRVWGYVSIMYTLSGIIQKRRANQRERELLDKMFLSDNYVFEIIRASLSRISIQKQ